MILTVTIPTYNRKSKLLERVHELANCPGIENVKVLIIDNDSDEDPSLDVLKVCEDRAINIKIVRNRANVGLCANICKCFEYTDTDWMWLLGDDDSIEKNSIQTILESIQSAAPQSVMIKFGGEAMKPSVNDPIQLEGLQNFAEFMNSAWRYSSMLFISSSVFKICNLRKHLNVAYTWSYSYAPHLAILLPAMRDGGITLIEPNTILENTIPNNAGGWNEWRLRMGTATLGEIEGCEIIADYSICPIFKGWGGNPWTSLPVMLLRSGDRPASFWKAYLYRVAGVSSGWTQWAYVVAVVIYIPLIRTRFIKRGLQTIIGKRSDLQHMDRL